MFAFWVDKTSLKNPKKSQFAEKLDFRVKIASERDVNT